MIKKETQNYRNIYQERIKNGALMLSKINRHVRVHYNVKFQNEVFKIRFWILHLNTPQLNYKILSKLFLISFLFQIFIQKVFLNN